jgi:hypothetical protein
MAIVTGPLHSDDARGKLGKALVFMGWKGTKTVRQWLKPMNKQSAGQGNIRTIIGATGRAVGKIIALAPYDLLLIGIGCVPATQSKQSYLVQFIKDNYFNGSGATLKSNYNTIRKEFTAVTGLTSWVASAGDLGLSDFGMVYDDIATYPKGLGLYLLAKAAIALSFPGTPYTKALSLWTATQIDKLVNHLS